MNHVVQNLTNTVKRHGFLLDLIIERKILIVNPGEEIAEAYQKCPLMIQRTLISKK